VQRKSKARAASCETDLLRRTAEGRFWRKAAIRKLGGGSTHGWAASFGILQ
jgi:hypothetical protein